VSTAAGDHELKALLMLPEELAKMEFDIIDGAHRWSGMLVLAQPSATGTHIRTQ
jgi:hypothetical protein